MKQYIYTVHDQKAEAFLPCFQAPTDGIAERSFKDLVNQDGHQFSRYAEDYTLIRVACIDDSTGVVTPENPLTIAQGIALKRKSVHPHQSSDSEL